MLSEDGCERIIREVVSIQVSGNDRHRRTVVLYEAQEKELVFELRNSNEENVENIVIYFPSFCILGKKKLVIEILIPDKVLHLNGADTLLTPVVFIHQPVHIAFLQKVVVKLPFDRRVLTSKDDVEYETINCGKDIFVGADHFEIHSFSFSPVGIAARKSKVRAHHVTKSLL